MNASKQCAANPDARETEQQQLSQRDNRVIASALLLMIQKTRCTNGDLVGAVESIIKTLPALYVSRLITVARKRLDSLQ
jgi:predicted ATPase